MKLAIRSGAPARPALEAGDADPTHGSSDFQAFLQSEIGGLPGTSRLVHKTSTCPRINHDFPGFAEMLVLFVFPTFLKHFWKLWSGRETVVWELWAPVLILFVFQRFEGFWETICGQGNHLRGTMSTVEMASAQSPDPWFLQGFPMISQWNSHLPRGRPQPTAKEP